MKPYNLRSGERKKSTQGHNIDKCSEITLKREIITLRARISQLHEENRILKVEIEDRGIESDRQTIENTRLKREIQERSINLKKCADRLDSQHSLIDYLICDMAKHVQMLHDYYSEISAMSGRLRQNLSTLQNDCNQLMIRNDLARDINIIRERTIAELEASASCAESQSAGSQVESELSMLKLLHNSRGEVLNDVYKRIFMLEDIIDGKVQIINQEIGTNNELKKLLHENCFGTTIKHISELRNLAHGFVRNL